MVPGREAHVLATTYQVALWKVNSKDAKKKKVNSNNVKELMCKVIPYIMVCYHKILGEKI